MPHRDSWLSPFDNGRAEQRHEQIILRLPSLVCQIHHNFSSDHTGFPQLSIFLNNTKQEQSKMTEYPPVKKTLDSAVDYGADIAIIGMACHFAGGCTDPQKLWDFVLAGRSAAEKIPVERMSSKGFYHPDKNRVGAICTDTGCFLQGDITAFDAPFFAISKAEADAMDPQQRLLLENAYHALENGQSQISMENSLQLTRK